MDVVTKLVTALVAGYLPEGAAPYFSGAVLFGEKKKCEGIRPKAVATLPADPFAFLFFAVVFHPIIMKITSEVPDLLRYVWFLEDGTLMGKEEEMSRTVNIIRHNSPANGHILYISGTF